MEDDEAEGWASLAKRMKGASAPSAAAAASMEDEQARGDKQHSAEDDKADSKRSRVVGGHAVNFVAASEETLLRVISEDPGEEALW